MDDFFKVGHAGSQVVSEEMTYPMAERKQKGLVRRGCRGKFPSRVSRGG